MLGSTANSLEGLIEWNSVAPSSSREWLQSGANAAFSQGEPLLGRVDSSFAGDRSAGLSSSCHKI